MQITSSKFNNNVVSYTVTSKFKQPGVTASYNATVILLYRATQNTFYDKHVLRVGESSCAIWDERKGSSVGSGFDSAKCAAAASKGIFTGSNWSTFIRLKNIDIKEMVYGLAKALIENYLANNWPGGVGSYVNHLPIHAEFNNANCVVTLNPQGQKTYYRSIFMGGTLFAATGPNITFDLSHCSGAGPV